ncbi:MAG: hypothetical protein TREMPRED_000074, partial [Tremellales sp. Tagirdzhanova-0007]
IWAGSRDMKVKFVRHGGGMDGGTLDIHTGIDGRKSIGPEAKELLSRVGLLDVELVRRRRMLHPEQTIERTNNVDFKSKPATLARTTEKHLRVNLISSTAGKAKKFINESDLASHLQAFQQLPGYLDAILLADAEATVERMASVGNDGRTYLSQVFIAPSAMKGACHHLPPFFAIDGAHSRIVNHLILL